MAQFEALVRAEAAGFWTRRRAASLLQRALGEEQAGVTRMALWSSGGKGGGGEKRNEILLYHKEKDWHISFAVV